MTTTLHPDAGRPAPVDGLVDVAALIAAYYRERPDPAVPAQRVAFGTSGHRGSSLHASFNEAHIVAITHAICLYRRAQGVSGPLYLGWDTHALSGPARQTALEVLAGHGVDVMVDGDDGPTPTPVGSWAILVHNRGRASGLADGILVTPSHNPPEYGGFKYNPPHGGPADSEATSWIERTANALLAEGLDAVPRVAWPAAGRAATVHPFDYLGGYTRDLAAVIDVDAVRGSRLRVGVDPLGGASAAYWGPIAERLGIRLEVTNPTIDPTFRFMTLDWDGAIRMDPSSPYAMARLIELRDRYDLAFANDPDADRHGIVTRSAGLMNPNHYLAVAIDYLYRQRPRWRADAGVGKTVVSSSLIDRVAARLGRRLHEVPVGFKFFVDGLLDGSLGFGGEESAGASFLRQDGTVWTTDKDGLILGLLAVEMTARTGRDPGELYAAITAELGEPVYERIDAAASAAQRAALSKLSADSLALQELAGHPVTAVLTHAPGDGKAIGGVKVVTDQGWFAARPSGTEAVYKLYAESFAGRDHLRRIQAEAQAAVARALAAAGAQ
ncbi:MAG: phosphoglucomutase (alpha-D-glucose-1,6-bisphosphate-dependent) [bacterium]|nr:phosphoglucomutase (alpha-D-glucose-1,6-bisphosphate-dependent) [bacterium]